MISLWGISNAGKKKKKTFYLTGPNQIALVSDWGCNWIQRCIESRSMVKCLDFRMFAVYRPHSISQISALHLEDLFVQDLNEQFGAMATRGQPRPFSVVLKLKLNLLFQEMVCNAGDCSFSPWVGKIPWRREWLPTPVFLPGEFHGRGVWRATVRRIAKSQARLSNWHFHLSFSVLEPIGGHKTTKRRIWNTVPVLQDLS